MKEEPIKSYKQLMGEKYGAETPKAPVEKKKPNKKEDDNVTYTSFIETDDYILEQYRIAGDAGVAVHEGGTGYVKYDKKTGTTEKVDSFVHGIIEYRPIINKVSNPVDSAVFFPTGVKEYETEKKLTEEILAYMNKYFEVPEGYEQILASYVKFTWVYDRFPFVPYPHFVGVSGTGKSTASEVFGSICYKAIDASMSTSVSAIFRLANTWRGTLLLDEFDLNSKGKEGRSELLILLKSGVSDKPVFKVEGKGDLDVGFFRIKSPRVFNSEKPITDAGLQSRTILVPMMEKTRRLPLYRLADYEEKKESIRNQLLLWRFRKLPIINLEEMEYGYEELEAFEGRVQQVLTPIYYLSDKEVKKDLLEFAKKQAEETFAERRNTLEGLICASLYRQFKLDINPLLSIVYEDVNRDKDKAGFKTDVSPRLISNRIRKPLGFEYIELGHDKIKTIIGQEEKIESYAQYYGISIPPPRPATPASTAPASKSAGDKKKVRDLEIDPVIQEIFET